MAHKTDDGSWRVRYRKADGSKGSKTFKSKAEALRFEAAMKSGEDPVVVRSVTFAQWAETYMADYATLRKSPRSVHSDAIMLRLYLIPAWGSKSIHGLTRGSWEDLVVKLSARLSPKSVNNVKALASRMFTYAVDRRVMSANPLSGVKPLKVPKKPTAYWTIADRDRFLAAAREDDYAMWELVSVAVFTGLRLGEQRALRVGDIKFGSDVIEVSRSFSRELGQLLDRTKNGEVEHVPIAPAIREIFERRARLPSDSWVFKQDLFRGLYDRFQNRCKRYGVPILRWHDLRHTFASNLVELGVPLYDVQKLMRHKLAVMTQRYAHVAPAQLYAAVQLLSDPIRPRAALDLVQGGEK